MAILKIQLESQDRPVYAAAQDNVGIGSAAVINFEGMEQMGEVVDRLDALETCLKVIRASFLRLASAEDLEKRKSQKQVEDEAFRFCQRSVRELKLLMKLVKVHYYFDGSKMMFYYTAESRVDFRELVKILAHKFRTRIEMRQIGVRDETRLCGGRGHCGLKLCCANHLNQFAPVTVKMAKDQGLSLNPAKISGMCGRLMCCLRYEMEPEKTHAEQTENSN
jgi:cell fate regulator YaaT (PSP1 superfamily)